MTWGFFKKLVLADRAAPFVAAVFDQPERHAARHLALAAALFSLQIYGDLPRFGNEDMVEKRRPGRGMTFTTGG